MNKAGYRTSFIGKYLNSYDRYFRSVGSDEVAEGLMVGWDDFHTLLGRSKYTNFEIDDNGTVSRRSGHQSDVLAELAVRFIDDSAGRDRPFFLYITPQAPHAPVEPAGRHEGLFADVTAPRHASFNQADVSGQPSLAETKRLGRAQVARIDRDYRRALQTLQSVDELVRDVVLALERNGVLESTYVFYTSDNGFHFGEHRIRKGKGTPFEEAIRFPLIVRGPGVPKGVVLPHLVSNVDIHPTVLDLIGEEPGEQVDGRSLLPLFDESAAEPAVRTSLVIESDHTARNSGVPRFQGIRTLRYKLVEYDSGESELYDLVEDPHETRNVIREVAPAVVADLRARLEELGRCAGSACRRIENARLVRVDH